MDEDALFERHHFPSQGQPKTWVQSKPNDLHCPYSPSTWISNFSNPEGKACPTKSSSRGILSDRTKELGFFHNTNRLTLSTGQTNNLDRLPSPAVRRECPHNGKESTKDLVGITVLATWERKYWLGRRTRKPPESQTYFYFDLGSHCMWIYIGKNSFSCSLKICAFHYV